MLLWISPRAYTRLCTRSGPSGKNAGPRPMSPPFLGCIHSLRYLSTFHTQSDRVIPARFVSIPWMLWLTVWTVLRVQTAVQVYPKHLSPRSWHLADTWTLPPVPIESIIGPYRVLYFVVYPSPGRLPRSNGNPSLRLRIHRQLFALHRTNKKADWA